MTPQLGFVIAGLLFLLAMIAGLALLLVVAAVALRVGGPVLLDELARRDEPDPAAALAQLLVDLAEHHQQHGGWADQTVDLPPVIEITAVNRTSPRSSRTDR